MNSIINFIHSITVTKFRVFIIIFNNYSFMRTMIKVMKIIIILMIIYKTKGLSTKDIASPTTYGVKLWHIQNGVTERDRAYQP